MLKSAISLQVYILIIDFDKKCCKVNFTYFFHLSAFIQYCNNLLQMDENGDIQSLQIPIIIKSTN